MLFKEAACFCRSNLRRRLRFSLVLNWNWSALMAWLHSPELVCHVSEAAKIPPPQTSEARRRTQAARITPELGISTRPNAFRRG